MMERETPAPGALIEFPDAAAMAEYAADRVCDGLEKALAYDGAALLALSGGSTPKLLHEILSTRPLAWSRVAVAPVDERWVGDDHPGSNEKFIRETLLQNHAAGARLTGLKTSDPTPNDGVSAASARLAMIARPPDAVVLGMGTDGHTASWFPHADGLADALSLANAAPVAGIRARQSDVTGALIDRITMTLPYILKAPTKILLLQGAAKKEVFLRALDHGQDNDVDDMPVRALLKSADDLIPCWAP